MLVLGARNELDDLCTHTNASHAAMAIRPASASDVRYAVIGFPSELMRGRSLEARFAWGANLIPCVWGRVRSFTQDPRRAPTRSRVPAIGVEVEGSDDGAQTTPRRRAWEMWRRDLRPPSDSKIPMKKPAADVSARASDVLQ
jgi:hypothetical protein